MLLPVFNAAATIKAAVDSILNQSMAEFELIIINDGSSDQTADMLTSINDERISTIHFEENKGIVAALNTGIAASSAAYIARMDADDVCAPNRLELQYNYLLAHREIDVLSCLVNHGGDQSSQAGYRFHVDWINSKVSPEEIKAAIYTESPICHPSVMMRKSLFQQFGEYRKGDFPEDYELWLRLMHQGVRFAKIPEVLYTWNDPINRLSRVYKAYSEEAFYEIKVKCLKEVLAKLAARPIYVWGHSKKVLAKAAILTRAGIEIEAYIDIKSTDSQKRKVVFYQKIEDFKKIRVLSLLNVRKGGQEVAEFLSARGLIQNDDYFLLS